MTSQVAHKSSERTYRQMYYIVEMWGSCNREYYDTVDWVVTSCGLVDGYHCLGGSNGDTTPTTASAPVYQFTPCHSVGDREISTVILLCGILPCRFVCNLRITETIRCT